MRKIFFLLLVLLNADWGYSYDFHRNFEPTVIKNGVNNNTIYDICYGRDGFIWMSTDLGISRYDGFRFRDYSLISSLDSNSIPLPQAIRKIIEVSDNLLYTRLYQGGIICFDKDKEKYLPVRFNKPFKQKDIQDIYWNKEILYLATKQGLFEAKTVRKEDKKGEFIFCTIGDIPLVKGGVSALCSDGKSELYFSVDSKKVMRYNLVTKKKALIQEYNVVNRLFFVNGYLWICRLWNDIICYDLKKQKERVIIMGTVDNADYSNSYVTDIVCSDPKTYYLTTWDGLFKLDFENKDISESTFALTLLTDRGQAFNSKVENKMTSVLWDSKQHILWAGTFGGGLVKLDFSDSMYSRVLQELNMRVRGIAEDNMRYIWLLMADGKIMKSTSPELSGNTHFELWEKSVGFSNMHCLYKDKNGYFWMGNNQGKVVVINPLLGDVKSFQLLSGSKDNTQISVRQFCQDSRNRVWVATSSGLIMVDPENYTSKKIEPGQEKIENVYSVAEDKEGNIWLGTGRGLKRLEFNGNQIRLEGNYEKENGLEDSSVQTIYVNNYNQIYVSYLNVVARIDGRNKSKFESIYTLKKGLTNGHVACMIDDQIGNTWAGNNDGVMSIRNGQEAFYKYLSVGNCNAVCRLNDGRLLWANSWGLIFFDPEAAKVDGGKKRLMLTDIEVNGETAFAEKEYNGQVILSVAPENLEKLVFHPGNNDFCLHFSDLRYTLNERRIAYRLLPNDEEWRMQPLGKGISFNKLSAGKYSLQVKLVFPDGKEGEVLQMPIAIKAVWYHTGWAYFLYVIIFLLISYMVYRHLEKKDMRRQIMRDREIILKEKLSLEKMKQQQKQEIDSMRNRMLTIFVQELRTPLSLIIAPLKDLLKEKTLAPEMASRGQVAYRNSLRMVDACNQLLAIYGRDNLSDKLNIASYQIEKLVDNNLSDIREMLKVNAINFQYEKRIKKEMELYTDKKKVEFIIHYLLTNAFTHINYTGNVTLTICEMVWDNTHHLTIIVEDNGKSQGGIVDQLLDESTMPEKDAVSIEMGFSAIQRMVSLLHGTILLNNEEGKGRRITVNLPTGKEIFEKDSNVVFVEPEKLDDAEFESKIHPNSDQTVDVIWQNTDRQIDKSAVEEIDPSVSKGGKKTILIVEDHKDIRLYLKVLFGKEYNLLMATNGQEGVDMAIREVPDLIICDVMMPVKDGFECCREVKENMETCSIPFIILTAKVEDEDVVHGLEVGADDYVLKPFTPSILKAKVRSLISGRQTLKQMYTKLLKLPGTDNTVVSEVEVSEEGENVEDPFISSVIKIVEENISEADFSVKKLASVMNMSQPTLYRKVKQSTDYTIIELIRGVRMRRAAVLLKTKQYAVQDVVEMVGYNDIPTFRKHFVDAFGTTPSTYE